MTISPVLPILPAQASLGISDPAPIAGQAVDPSRSFVQLLIDGVDKVNSKLATAEKLVNDFATNDAIPIHQVTYALEDARLSMEMTMQVRSHLLDAYQQLMNMQL